MNKNLLNILKLLFTIKQSIYTCTKRILYHICTTIYQNLSRFLKNKQIKIKRQIWVYWGSVIFNEKTFIDSGSKITIKTYYFFNMWYSFA